MKYKIVFIGPLEWESGREWSIWQQELELSKALNFIHSDEFKDEIAEIFKKTIPDSAKMSAAECHRQRSDFAEGIHFRKKGDLGIMINLTQIFTNPKRDLQAFAKKIGDLFARFVEKQKLPAGIFGEVYASNSEDGTNVVIEIKPAVLIAEY